MSEYNLIKEANDILKEINAEDEAIVKEGLLSVYGFIAENPDQDIFTDEDIAELNEMDRSDLDWARQLRAEQVAAKERKQSVVADEFAKKMAQSKGTDPEEDRGTSFTPSAKDVVKTNKGVYTIIAIDTKNGNASLQNIRGEKVDVPLNSLTPAGVNKISGRTMFTYKD